MKYKLGQLLSKGLLFSYCVQIENYEKYFAQTEENVTLHYNMCERGIMIYKKLFLTKTKALKFEYMLKKNRKKRFSILKDYYDSVC